MSAIILPQKVRSAISFGFPLTSGEDVDFLPLADLDWRSSPRYLFAGIVIALLVDASPASRHGLCRAVLRPTQTLLRTKIRLLQSAEARRYRVDAR